MKPLIQSNGRKWLLLIASLLIAILMTFDLVRQQGNIEHSDSVKVPFPISNNAVTKTNNNGEISLLSFNGLEKERKIESVTNRAFAINLSTNKVKEISPVPNSKGVLASIAVSINSRVLVIGGYTVANDHSEKSMPQIFEYFPERDSYELLTEMPVPVDDTVALVYQQRYLYLVSGWHDVDNVSLVQVYDLKKDLWFNATPFPGAPVFGHAGGIVDDKLLIVDGVKVNGIVDGKRQYGPSDENWVGEILQENPAIINWQKIPKHPFKPLYRMASAGVKDINQVVFVGGSDNPYNFDGIGYNGVPSEPSSKVFSFSFDSNLWHLHEDLIVPSMDHRGLVVANSHLYVIGGMTYKQKVLDTYAKISLVDIRPKISK